MAIILFKKIILIDIIMMRSKINSACNECVNELNEYLTKNFEKRYLNLEKELNSYKEAKNGFVEEINYNSLYLLRDEIQTKIRRLGEKINKLIENAFKY